jgi:hypothetical protein
MPLTPSHPNLNRPGDPTIAATRAGRAASDSGSLSVSSVADRLTIGFLSYA